MKKLTVLGSVAVIMGAGYTALWLKNASNLEEDAHKSIDQLNKWNEAQNLKVESIVTSGFPSQMTLEFKDIKVKVLDHFKAHLDTYIISRGMYSNSYKTRSHGDVVFSYTAPKPEDSLELIFKPGTESSAEVTFRGNQFFRFLSGRMQMSPDLEEDKDWQLINQLKCFEWKDTGHELIEKRTGKTLIKHGPTYTKLSLDPIDDISHKLELKLSTKDLEFSPELDQKLQGLFQTFAPLVNAYSGAPNVPYDQFFSLSASGKSSTELEANYKGPLSSSQLGQKETAFDLDISKYETSNKFHTGKMQLQFAGQLTKEKFIKDATFKLAGTYKATQDFSDYVNLKFKQLAQAELDKAAEDKVPTEFSPDRIPEFLQYVFIMHANRIIPDFAKWGEIKYVVDFKIDKASKRNELNEFSLVTDKFGIRIKGFADMAKANSRNDSIEVTLINKQELVDRLYAYASELLDISKETTKNDFNIKLDPGLKKHILDFINQVEEKQEKEGPDSTIKITMTGDKLTIGQMDGAQAIMTLMALFMGQ